MQEKQRPYFEFLAKTILDQRKRLGGDMAITHTIHSRKSRETLRTLLGKHQAFKKLDPFMLNHWLFLILNRSHGSSISLIHFVNYIFI